MRFYSTFFLSGKFPVKTGISRLVLGFYLVTSCFVSLAYAQRNSEKSEIEKARVNNVQSQNDSALIIGLGDKVSFLDEDEEEDDAGVSDENSQDQEKNLSLFKDPNHVLAVVDGKNITVRNIDEISKNLEGGMNHIPEDKRYTSILHLYINMLTLAKAAQKAGYEKTPLFKQQMNLARDNILQKIYFQKQILDKITDADIKARYEKSIASLPKEEEVHARHILVKTKKEAEDLIDRLNKGENFEELAKKNSIDGSAAVGGDAGYFSHGQMVEPFEKAAFSLKPGEYTKTPVETPFGWHIIKVEDKRLKPPPALDDVKGMIRNFIARDRSEGMLKDLQRKIHIKYPDPSIAKAMKDNRSSGLLTEDNEED